LAGNKACLEAMANYAHSDTTPGVTATALPVADTRTLAHLRDACVLAVIGLAEVAWLGAVVYAVLRFVA